jgi:hypothetical protein
MHQGGLTVTQVRGLRLHGFLVIDDLLGSADVQRVQARLEPIVQAAVPMVLSGPPLDGVEAGVVSADLDADDPVLAVLHEHSVVVDAASAVLGDRWRLRELGLRAPLPGFGHQGLHPDYGQRGIMGVWQSLSAMWCVSPHTAETGCLRVIPGSHRVAQDPTEQLAFGSGMGPHPDEVRLVANPGSLILFNGADLWHSGTLNYSSDVRLAATASFVPCQ